MIRIGHGYDVHKFAENRKCIIGGVEIPYEKGLFGHSDADVLLHAVCDALLGAAALGDIVALLNESGFKIGNIDATIIAQKPKMAKYIDAMRQNIADDCNIDVSFVNVKATTEEGLGFTGALEGISSHAVCIIE